MFKRLLVIACIVCTASAIFGAMPTNAESNAPQGAKVSASNIKYAALETICGRGFNYRQRMTIEGAPSMFVAVEVAVPPGHYDASLVDSCDGYVVYEFGSCACQHVALEL